MNSKKTKILFKNNLKQINYIIIQVTKTNNFKARKKWSGRWGDLTGRRGQTNDRNFEKIPLRHQSIKKWEPETLAR